jgi:hypothetical protein
VYGGHGGGIVSYASLSLDVMVGVFFIAYAGNSKTFAILIGV